MDPQNSSRCALAAAVAYLRCPVCADPVRAEDTRLCCDREHSFDIARHGYVNLTAGRAGPGTGDTAAMVAARDRFLGGGHYRPLAAAIRSLAAQHDPAAQHAARGMVVDLAGGTGYYLAAALNALPHRHGVCVDLSPRALRRAARAHPRAAALGADVWRQLPLADRSAAIVLSIFAPRNAAETGRILTRGGTLIIVTPGTGHLRELRQSIGTIGIEKDKQQRLADSYRSFTPITAKPVRHQLTLGRADLTALVSMGPSARHIAPEDLVARIRSTPSPATITVDLNISVYRRPG